MSKLLGNSQKGLLFIISAPAGTGKTTLVHMLTKEFPQVCESVSFTTRYLRPNEIEGKHYFFVSKDEFELMVRNQSFLEYVELYGFYYGTSKAFVEEKLNEGKHVVLVIDTQGALALQKTEIPAIYIFLKPPSMEELEKRLINRKTESEKKVEERIEWAEKELQDSKFYNYHIVNDDLQIAYQVLRSIVIAEDHRNKKDY
ncbi:Guanylate kinase [Candidatus Rubidus massiliensis]|nr:MAG: guanylate kinase [Chlamydia sp. 32-24]CDZ80677.1 Guanylate kinase [Candidatus Rubidus massiliensis]